jgi:hypothetical protein
MSEAETKNRAEIIAEAIRIAQREALRHLTAQTARYVDPRQQDTYLAWLAKRRQS